MHVGSLKRSFKIKREKLYADKAIAAVQQKGNPAKKAKRLSKAKSASLDGNQEKPDLVSDSNDTENELEMICIDLGIELDEGEIGDEVSVSGILETSITKDTDERGIEFDYNRSTLCEDFSCFSHCVNLIATTDFKKVLESGRASSFKLAHEKAFGKLQRLGNLSSGTIRASKIISDTIGCQLKTPCATRWNSEFDSFKCVMDQPEDKLNSAMKKLKLELLDEADRVLLKEQVAIMSPLTKYLDVLQSKNDMDTGINREAENDPLDIPSRVSSVMNELDLYLGDQDKSLLALNKYPRIKELFLRYNTGLPSSGASRNTFQCGASCIDNSKKPPY
ncbi:hypothetical protein OUZ56_024267 [Daphnia magna]|uniref:Uncharacterized protein n=1 Tax=Daphnia magna TaxID=35525 RepID=A0ABR0B0H9_9CRUS|nr:hypothetical protein OUZ56_024267 [Daphnia magna]